MEEVAYSLRIYDNDWGFATTSSEQIVAEEMENSIEIVETPEDIDEVHMLFLKQHPIINSQDSSEEIIDID